MARRSSDRGGSPKRAKSPLRRPSLRRRRAELFGSLRSGAGVAPHGRGLARRAETLYERLGGRGMNKEPGHVSTADIRGVLKAQQPEASDISATHVAGGSADDEPDRSVREEVLEGLRARRLRDCSADGDSRHSSFGLTSLGRAAGSWPLSATLRLLAVGEMPGEAAPRASPRATASSAAAPNCWSTCACLLA